MGGEEVRTGFLRPGFMFLLQRSLCTSSCHRRGKLCHSPTYRIRYTPLSNVWYIVVSLHLNKKSDIISPRHIYHYTASPVTELLPRKEQPEKKLKVKRVKEALKRCVSSTSHRNAAPQWEDPPVGDQNRRHEEQLLFWLYLRLQRPLCISTSIFVSSVAKMTCK